VARKLRSALTGSRLPLLSAFSSALLAEGVGMTVNLAVPAVAMDMLPGQRRSLPAGIPLNSTWPFLQFVLRARKAPNFPFWKLSNQLSLPGSETDKVNVIAPVFGFAVGSRRPLQCPQTAHAIQACAERLRFGRA
jgi:hypothetical protein